MLATVRQLLIEKLWVKFITSIPNAAEILRDRQPVLDHLAIIDLPSQHSGIPVLQRIFAALGFVPKGSGYLPEKTNDFIWMMPEDNTHKLATESLPQIVLADFRSNLLTQKTQQILDKFTSSMALFDFNLFEQYLQHLPNTTENIVNMVFDYLNWQPVVLPTLAEYNYVKHENQLIAWVMLFGRKINHFGLSIHHLEGEQNLLAFNKNIHAIGIALNAQGGEIKGSKQYGIEQSSTLGKNISITLDKASIEVRDSFLEFVWRYPIKPNPRLWSDYFTGFIPYNANSVIESVYDLAV